jgi:site-specific DNA-cytosine methylase
MAATMLFAPVAELAVSIAARQLGWEAGTRLRYAAFYSGAWDPFFTALRTAGMDVTHEVLVDENGIERQILREARAIPWTFTSPRAAAAVIDPDIQVASWAPSCKKTSSAFRAEADEGIDATEEKARDEMMEAADSVELMVRRTSVRAVFIEQSVGLKHKMPALYREFCDRLKATGLSWQHGKVQADQLGACHKQQRLLWVGWRN